MPKGTRLTKGIRRARGNRYNIIDKVKDAFNRPKTQQVQHKETDAKKTTTKQVVHKMPDHDPFAADRANKPKSMDKPTTVTIPSNRPVTSAPTAAPISASAFSQNFRNDALALMQRKDQHYANPEHMRNFASSTNLGEGLDKIRLIYNPDRGDGTSYRHYDVAATQDNGGVIIKSFKDYDDAGIKDAINKAYTKYRDTNFVETDPMYQRFQANYGIRDDIGQEESYINYNPNTNKFSLFDHSVGEPTDYFEDIPGLLKAGQKLSYRRNQ